MMKIIIADDEDFIRQGMHYAIPWEDHDMEVAGEAGNGSDALELALRIRPDIVLADIQMPLMNGLDLARRLNELLPDTRVIILTAYGSTENLSTAIDVKVSAFILKNADSNQILNTVLRVKKEAETLREKSSQNARLKDIYTENSHLIKATLMSRFLQNQISFSHFQKRAENMHFDFQGSSYSLLLIRTNGEEESLVIRTLTNQLASYHPFAFFTEDRIAAVILDTSYTPFESQQIDDLVSYILPVVSGNCLVIFSTLTGIREFPLAYSMAKTMLDHCFWKTDTSYVLMHPDDQITESAQISPYSYERCLIAAVLSHDEEDIQNQLSCYYTHMRDHQTSRTTFLDSVKRLIVLLCAISPDSVDPDEIVRVAEESETPEEILGLLESLTASSPETPPETSQITPALDYIDQHYMDDIRLEDAARAAYLSAGYLSRIFKNLTGYSFKEYLHRQRILRAQELILQTDYKYYEIAEMTGYRDYKYFSAYFSKITGCSAKEYRHSGRQSTKK